MAVQIGILTISDSVAQGGRADLSGQAIRELVTAAPLEGIVAQQLVVPDDYEQITAILRRWADDLHLELVLTTGGTGLGPRDITPEATRAVIEREAPGIAEAIRAESLRHTPFGMLSRGIAGARGRTLIINLPGSPKAVRESLQAILPALPHAVALLTGAFTQHS
jgi:molybdopterin adenylyltransferase